MGIKYLINSLCKTMYFISFSSQRLLRYLLSIPLVATRVIFNVPIQIYKILCIGFEITVALKRHPNIYIINFPEFFIVTGLPPSDCLIKSHITYHA